MFGAGHIQPQPASEFFFCLSQEPLREWAYVMWDRARLDEWNDSEKPWEYIDTTECDRRERR